MLYQFKRQVEDFIVEELLAEFPSGKGERFYVYFEKKNLTTMEVVEHLQRSLSLSREELGIAGLKDKVGITKQWISISQMSLKKLKGESAFLSVLSEVVKVLETSWHERPLRIGGNSGNRFVVRLRKVDCHVRKVDCHVAVAPRNDEIHNLIEQNIERVKVKGFPNCFEYQRFGKGMKNFWEAKKILCWKTPSPSGSSPLSGGSVMAVPYHLRFMLQAYASGYFNEYVMRRWEKGLHLLGGDIMVDRYYASGARVGVYENGGVREFANAGLMDGSERRGMLMQWQKTSPPSRSLCGTGSPYKGGYWLPTGPMLGWDLLLPPEWSKARVREDRLFEFAGFDEQVRENCKKYQLRGIRRPLRVEVPDLQRNWEKDDLLLRFSLPTGSYATVLLAFVLENIDRLTLKDNKLEIPRVRE